MKEGQKVPEVTFKYRVRTDGKPITFVDETNGGDNPFEFKDIKTNDIFKDSRVVVFAVVGAFTATCSMQLPEIEKQYQDFRKFNIDEVYVMSVNDTFVMRRWIIDQEIKNTKFIPDGNAEFADGMSMLADLGVVGFGNRSRRYAMIVKDGTIEKMFVEPDSTADNPDPYGESSPESVLEYLFEETIAELT